jgi:hypothetical protein
LEGRALLDLYVFLANNKLMAQLIDLTGRQFGRLLVIHRVGYFPGGSMYACKCDCGALIKTRGPSLIKGWTASCGCYRRECGTRRTAKGGAMDNRKHGLHQDPLYKTWRSMLTRCDNPTAPDYPRYGGRGITIDARWREFTRFYADVHPRPAGMTLDRVDNDGPYSPDNWRWATRKEQQRNRRANHVVTFAGQSLTIAAWAEQLGMSWSAFDSRIRHGWDLKRATSTPLRKRCKP